MEPMATRSIPILTDEQLIELMKKGDRKAGDSLVMRHNRLVARAVYEVVRDLAAVEDLIQEIFMKAFRKAHLYNPEQGKFTVWLTTVARHEAINHLRRMKRSRHVSLDDTAPEGGWGRVIDAIHKLPEPARTILIKRILESKPFDHIAKLLKQPVDTVKTIYYRNTESLRKKLGIPGL
jgi:RNA polymerase sigma-70 factor (ECF subfamily)